MLSDPIACPRCQATDVAATDCAACGSISWITCRACGHEGCRDLLCELRSHDRAFRKRLALMVTLLGAMTAAMLMYGGPLREMSLGQLATVRMPDVARPESGVQSPAPEVPRPQPTVPSPEPPPSIARPPPSPPAAFSPPPPPASSPPPPATPAPTADLVPGLAGSGDGPGFWVQDIDEADLRAGRSANSGPRTVSPFPEPSNDPVAPAHDPWARRLDAVLKESLAARYSPTGTSLRTGLSPGGLVHWVFRRLGVSDVPVDIATQMESLGERVDPRNYRPEPGDLLFFKIGNLHHVGIYFEKDQNTFVTVVPSKGGVVVADWDHAFFRSRFLFARRIVPPGL